MSKTIFCMAPLQWSGICVYVHVCACVRACACLCVCMCMCAGVCVHSRPDSNWLWLHFHRIFTGRGSGSGPSRRNGIREGNSSPHPRHTLFSWVCGHRHTCALWIVSSITWVISIINEVCWWQKWYQRRRRPRRIRGMVRASSWSKSRVSSDIARAP